MKRETVFCRSQYIIKLGPGGGVAEREVHYFLCKLNSFYVSQCQYKRC